jgi:hypothetical protein
MALTDDDKNRARGHLGYLGVAQASTFVLGIPAGVQTQFMVEAAWDRLLPTNYAAFRQLLDRLDGIEQQIEDDTENVAVDQLGDITLRKDEFPQLVRRYLWWQRKLANMLGIVPNPFDQRFNSWNGGGGVNVRVSG